MNGNHIRPSVARGVALLLVWALAPGMRAGAEEAADVDTSKWPCKFCTFEEPGFTFTPDLGAGYVSDDSAKFGEYNGMDELGAYVVADADGRYRGKDGLWLEDVAPEPLRAGMRWSSIEHLAFPGCFPRTRR